MSNLMVPFSFGDAPIRAMLIDGEPHFVARDVAAALGYAAPDKAVRDHCKGATDSVAPTAGGMQRVRVIPERDVYRLVMRSKLPSAERFEEWVVGEVLPRIRKTGSYNAAPLNLNDPHALRAALLSYSEQVIALQGAVAEKDAVIEKQAPAVEFARTIRDMTEAIDFGSMARLLKIGRNTLMAKLRDDSILMDNNLPYQAYMDRGYFKVIEGTRERSDGTMSPTFTTRVTGRGQVFLQRRYAGGACRAVAASSRGAA
jgi:anti-repressor protein